MFSKLKYWFQITRPNNVLIAFLSVWMAAIVAGGIDPIYHLLLVAFSAAFITVGANVINDIFDVEIDRINKPYRPIPSGNVSITEAYIIFAVSYLIAWVMAWMVNYSVFLVALVFGLLLILYSFRFKRMVLIGNFVVSLATGMAFIYGGMAVNRIEGTFYPALFAFFFHFGREIIKDLQDVEGDRARGANTLAVVYGTKVSLITASIIFILLIILTLIPYISKLYGVIYIFIILTGIYPVIFIVLYRCWKSPDPATLGKMSNLLKADMLIGLLAIYFG
jgi:geranylgeranylglycerol-phosphate geranylgeranyltransferase